MWHISLTVAAGKDRESAVSDPFGESLIFCPKIPLGRLFSKFIFKSFRDFVYFWNSRKNKTEVKVQFFPWSNVQNKARGQSFAAVLKWNHYTPKETELQNNHSSTQAMFQTFRYDNTSIFQAILKTPLGTAFKGGKM